MLYLAVILPFIVNFLPIENKKIKVLIAIAPAIYIILFRFGLGTDYFSYQFLYNNHDVSSFSAAMSDQARSMEVGFRFLIYIFKSLNFSFQFFVASVSLTIYLFIVKWIVDSDYNVLLQIMLFNGMFFIVWVLSGLRQGLVLAVATFFILNRRKQLSLWQEVLLVIILAQFHISAYVYLIIIFAKRFSFSKKILIAILCAGLIMTLIPYQVILKPLTGIVFIDKYFSYITNNTGFWDFSGLVRLVFVLFTLFFYDWFKKDNHILMLANLNILGFALYFFLKASEITASRVSIFTFILIIPLIAFIIEEINKRQVQLVLLSGTLVFSLIYLEKDLLNTQVELNQIPRQTFYKFKNILSVKDSDYLKFDSRFAFMNYQERICLNNKKIEENIVKSSLDYEALIVQEKGKYGIIDSIGNWLVEPTFSVKPELLKNIIINKDGIEDEHLNFNLEKISVDPSTLEKLKEENKLIKDERWYVVEVNYNEYENVLDKYFPNKEEIEEIIILKFKLPYRYAALRIKYKNVFNFFTLNNKLEISNDLLFKKVIRPDINYMDIGHTYCGSVGVNSNDDIVWINEK